MEYEKLLEHIKDVPKDTMKRVIFNLDQRHINQIKQMDIDEDLKKELTIMFKDRAFFEMLLVNSLM